MNWIRENKFLTGFIVILIIGAGGLGYLLYSSYGDYSDITDQYNQAASDLHQLQTRVPYPDQANLAKYRAEHDDLVDATHDLAASLSKMVLPIDDISPSTFQDRLRDTVSGIVARAGQTGVKLPEHFAMDFDQYQSQPPPQAAAGPLGRQLEALKIVMNILLDEHVDLVSGLTRTKLSQEKGATAAAGAGKPGQRAGVALVDKISFDVKFTANQPAFQKVLNDFAASSKQFFITRTLVLENSDPKPVSKTADSTPGAPATAAPGQPAAPGTPDASGGNFLKFIVGTEKLNVAMRIDIVSFNPPDKSTRKGAAPAH